MNRRIAALAIAAAALLGLAACTASPESSPTGSSSADAGADSSDGQSVAEACALIQGTIQEAADEFEGVTDGDPAVIVDAMRKAADDLAAAAEEITNEDVAAVLPGVQEMFEKTADLMQSIVEGDVSKISELGSLGTEFQSTVQEFQELCAPK